MCSLNNGASDMEMIDNRREKVNLKDDEPNERNGSRSLVLKEQELDELSQYDKMLCERFGVNKSKLAEHRKEIVENCLMASQCNSRIADTINIDGADTVHIGHVIHITEQIVLNVETNELELDSQKLKDYKDYFPLIDRRHWLAQPSVSEITYLKKPAHYVIICHTASQEAFTQAENVLMLRLLQTFHIESQGWADIAYNFCIGSDGNAYEGRGWFVQGSHTMSYNAYSVGIAFMGCFLTNLPPESSLKKCKDLIEHGVKIGAISPDYELLGHRQCRPFLSPGDCLFNEIQTWKHFNPNVTNTSPCKFSI